MGLVIDQLGSPNHVGSQFFSCRNCSFNLSSTSTWKLDFLCPTIFFCLYGKVSLVLLAASMAILINFILAVSTQNQLPTKFSTPTVFYIFWVNWSELIKKFFLCFPSVLVQFWVADPCTWNIRMGWIQSREDVEEQMGRNGGVAKKQSQITSTVRGTCTEGGSVQESLWKLLKLLLQVLELAVLMLIPTSPYLSKWIAVAVVAAISLLASSVSLQKVFCEGVIKSKS